MATSRAQFTPLPIDETRKRTPLKVPYSEEAYHCALPAPIPQRRGMNQQEHIQFEIDAIQKRVDLLRTQLEEHPYDYAGATLHELKTIITALEEWVQAIRTAAERSQK